MILTQNFRKKWLKRLQYKFNNMMSYIHYSYTNTPKIKHIKNYFAKICNAHDIPTYFKNTATTIDISF